MQFCGLRYNDRRCAACGFELICADNEIRIDKYLSQTELGLSRSAAASLIEAENVLVNGKAVNKKHKLMQGDIITVSVPDPVEYEAKAENIPLDIVYEDNDLLVVNKPKGMVVHPAAGNYEGTLVNALLYHCKDSLSGINGVMRPGIVHRIDKDTSGLLIVAKNDHSHALLAEQIKEHSFTREYEAVVFGKLKDDSGFKSYTYIKCKLETGRTHQIRVHMAYIGHPVAGDSVYGVKKEKTDFEGQCLHARKIGFVHPSSGKYMEFESDLPEYFKNFLKKLMS